MCRVLGVCPDFPIGARLNEPISGKPAVRRKFLKQDVGMCVIDGLTPMWMMMAWSCGGALDGGTARYQVGGR